MSMKRLALLSLLNNGGLNNNRTSNTEMSTTTGSPAVPSEGVNVMLGGIMLSGIILVIFIMCYCCHKTARKQEGPVPITYWRESALAMHVYTVESQFCEAEDLMLSDIRRPSTPGPPPAYELVVQKESHLSRTSIADSEPPSYECAMRMESVGHV